MKLKSLIQNGTKLEVAEVEIELIPGIPQIHFLGLPDRLIKESFYRIKSALKNSGYKFPLTNQIIVNIKPNHLRKSSRGVELAVALGILLKTGQIESSRVDTSWVLYGELGLDGSIYEPSDLVQNLFILNDQMVLTGKGSGVPKCYRLESLNSGEIHFTSQDRVYQRPKKGLERLYSEEEAEFLFLAATSGLHVLLAGDSGAGKTTLAHSLRSFLREPEENVRLSEDQWRPLVAPHHSITPAAFLGGGGNLYEGELERSIGGMLLLDEFLEFDADVLESLRGPMEGGTLRLTRASAVREVSLQVQVVATTNLCPCGQWTPFKVQLSCRFSRTRCRRYVERLSGPLVERFGILYFVKPMVKRQITGHQILQRIQRVRRFLSQCGQQSFRDVGLLESYYRHLNTRRRNYLRRIATVYALDRLSSSAQGTSGLKGVQLNNGDYNRAESWTLRPFEELEKGMS
ncbi:ATP-binding protein [Pseudobdellovibrio exovorus]|uniref:Competence protein ComM-like protein n=1 Tax=Pseudobdellovibrio exovorus JSS TaxID=1184267 RepID=M4V9X3_9BACT|nr:ATP-binding protein [Pseudobdellovibrio exovorus]AGH95260.1 competence protein ComM-like protein [Pseudobdellovibrio exovorus JSS]